MMSLIISQPEKGCPFKIDLLQEDHSQGHLVNKPSKGQRLPEDVLELFSEVKEIISITCPVVVPIASGKINVVTLNYNPPQNTINEQSQILPRFHALSGQMGVQLQM